ncbi:hypothetical protein AAY473_005611 [Plecturocebus cupreus]
MVQSWLTTTSTSQVQVILLPQPPKRGFTMLVRLVLNSRPQVIRPPWPPKCLDYRRKPPCPAYLTLMIKIFQVIRSPWPPKVLELQP